MEMLDQFLTLYGVKC